MTFFFNGGREVVFEGEERKLVPSPKVPTYDLQPEMNCKGVADMVRKIWSFDNFCLKICQVIEQVQLGKHPFIMCNFASPDMVGHTGQYEPAIKACEATGNHLGLIIH